MRLFVLLLALCLPGLPVMAQNTVPGPDGTITIVGAGGQTVGSAVIRQAKKGYIIELSLTGLVTGWHGVQIHAVGDCSDTSAFQRSGPIVGLAGEHHGLYNLAGPMDGDLPNIWIAADGTGKAQFYDPLILTAELADADGSAIVIRSSADDMRSEPDGQSGTRIACGIIAPNRLPPPAAQ